MIVLEVTPHAVAVMFVDPRPTSWAIWPFVPDWLLMVATEALDDCQTTCVVMLPCPLVPVARY